MSFASALSTLISYSTAAAHLLTEAVRVYFRVVAVVCLGCGVVMAGSLGALLLAPEVQFLQSRAVYIGAVVALVGSGALITVALSPVLAASERLLTLPGGGVILPIRILVVLVQAGSLAAVLILALPTGSNPALVALIVAFCFLIAFFGGREAGRRLYKMVAMKISLTFLVLLATTYLQAFLPQTAGALKIVGSSFDGRIAGGVERLASQELFPGQRPEEALVRADGEPWDLRREDVWYHLDAGGDYQFFTGPRTMQGGVELRLASSPEEIKAIEDYLAAGRQRRERDLFVRDSMQADSVAEDRRSRERIVGRSGAFLRGSPAHLSAVRQVLDPSGQVLVLDSTEVAVSDNVRLVQSEVSLVAEQGRLTLKPGWAVSYLGSRGDEAIVAFKGEGPEMVGLVSSEVLRRPSGGTEVWYRVQLPNGSTGYVPRSSVSPR